MLALSLALAPLAVEAQPASRKPRLCFLTFDPGTLRSTRYGPFFQGLRDLGYVDGQTLSIDYLSADGQAERLPALATECVRLNTDIIVVTTTPFAQAAKNVTRTGREQKDLAGPNLLDVLDTHAAIARGAHSGCFARRVLSVLTDA